jgi:hypothetical protein
MLKLKRISISNKAGALQAMKLPDVKAVSPDPGALREWSFCCLRKIFMLN